MEDPEQKTKFYQETARKLLRFGEPLERDNYIQAVSSEYMIPYQELKGMVNRMGMTMGLKAGEAAPEGKRSGRAVLREETDENRGEAAAGGGGADGKGPDSGRPPACRRGCGAGRPAAGHPPQRAL